MGSGVRDDPIAVSNIVELTLIDFVHGNPHRPKSNAVEMMIVFTPLFAVVSAIGAVLVFALPQCLEAVVAGGSTSRFGKTARFCVLCILPLTAVLTWYCYDYLTPTVQDNYQHGLTAQHYLMALAGQTPITLFNFIFLDAGVRGRPRKAIVFIGLVVATVLGIAWGRHLAGGQLQFL